MNKKPNSKMNLKTTGAVVWFTGLSGSGKSTVAEKLVKDLLKKKVDIEYLDGDKVRDVFPQTGFSRDERNMHVKRIGFLASILEKHGILVIASFISPYREGRNFTRKLCRKFIEVHISTPISECMKRDPKGLYARAKRGEIKNFTGLDDPYEAPQKPEIRIDTSLLTVKEAVSIVVDYLKAKDILQPRNKKS